MLSPEINLILASCKPLNSEIRIKHFQNLAGKIKDWEALINISSTHGMAALLYTALKETGKDIVPPATMRTLQQIYTKNAVRNLSMAARLISILDLFENNGITAVPFKGPLIAMSAYGDLNCRSFCDLDIIIDKLDVKKAKTVLIQSGFKEELILPSDQHLHSYLEHENSLSFYKDDLSIDLHWEITGRYLLDHIYLDSVKDRLETSVLLERKIKSLPEDLLLVYLSVHGCSHCWERFEWLCCFSELARKQNPEDLISAHGLAQKIGASRMFLLALDLSEYFLELKLPKTISESIDKDMHLQKIAHDLKSEIFLKKPSSGDDATWRFSPLHINIRDNLKSKVNYLVYLLTKPTVKEWSLYPLPLSLVPLYTVVRPFRLIYIFLAVTLNSFFKKN